MTEQEPQTNENDSPVAEESIGHQHRDASLTLGERFEILKNERRRYVLEYLSNADETVTLSDLADYIAAIENDSTVEDVTSSERKRVYVALYQFHLPKMDRMGVIEYDKDRGDVSLVQKGRELYQEHDSTEGPPGYLHLLGICACVLGIVALIGVALIQAWFVGSVILGIQTAIISVRAIAEYRLWEN